MQWNDYETLFKCVSPYITISAESYCTLEIKDLQKFILVLCIIDDQCNVLKNLDFSHKDFSFHMKTGNFINK